MAPLVLEGETLGQKQHSFNKLVEAALSDETTDLLPLDYDAPDVDNLLRIDVACRRRNVDYVLHVLQSEDLLYVSRAIKQSTWLITDDQYAHIINPTHLHNELFPKMMGKAKNKLLSAIRLKLKNETRVDEFFKYYEYDLKIAQKWLPFCSIALIEKVYQDRADEITVNIFKRLCWRTINVLKLYIKYKLNNYDREYNATEELKASKFLLNKYPEEYLLILKSYVKKIPDFRGKATRYMMKHAREIVVNNFEIFNYHIHIPTFVKCLKKEDVPGFLMTLAEGKMKHFIRYHHIKHFVKKLPMPTFELKLQFLNKLFKIGINPDPGLVGSVSPKTYRWYKFAPFDTAFTDMKKLIREESSPEDRANMLKILISCARRDPRQLQTLVRYYREKHMNEASKFKVQFVDSLLSSVVTHRFDEETWRILDDIFTSMEVYVQSNSNPLDTKKVRYLFDPPPSNHPLNCVKAIIVYKLLHNEDIPEIIKNKQTFDTFKDYRKNLEEKERNVLFKYLYSLEMSKLQKQTVIKNETEILKVMENLDNVFLLLKDWEMKLSDFPEVLKIIRNIIRSKKEHSININLVGIYNVEKKWRQDLFEDSLALQNNDAACIHALKHDPGLLLRHRTEVAAMCSNDTISLKNTLSKLRIYWAQSLAQEWTEQYIRALEKPTGHKATVEGICILFPRKQFINIITKYAPTKTRIDWSNSDTITLSVQKNIAKRMMLVRPSLKLDPILLYAKDDYLQFALPSLNAILYNMSATQVSEHITILFDWPVSLKKHGIRLAYSKLNFSEIKDLVEHTWRNTKNSSIKRLLFKETFKLLKIEKKNSAIIDLWQVQSMFIENLTPDENKLIYNTLVNDEYVKLPQLVRPKFFMKAYTYLKSLPANADCENILTKRHTYEITNFLEPTFVEQVMLKPVDELITIVTEKSDDSSEFRVNIPLMIAYIANSDNEKSQYAKYEKYLIPILDACFKSWKIYENGEYIVMKNCFNLLKGLVDIIESSITNKYVLNDKVFKDIETRYRTALPLEENYRHITFWTIATLFVESYNSYLMEPVNLIGDSGDIELSDVKTDKEEEKRFAIHTAVAPLFGKSCSNFIKQDISSKLPSLADFFATSLSDAFDCLGFAVITRFQTLRNMLDSDVPVSYLIVLEATCSIYCDDEKSIKLRQEIYNTIRRHPSEEVKVLYHAYAARNEIEEV